MSYPRYFLIIFLLVFTSILSYSQVLPKGNALIRDTVGDIQYRSIMTPIWTPSIAGIKIPERSFIRLNSPESILTLSFSDGSFLRIFGISSLYIDYISHPINNNYQTKLLLLTGRWFYSSNPNNNSRLIVNTEITTSVIENGSGGGYLFNGTNEFIIRTGRGIISYRQKDILALVVDERQKVSFDIYTGFNYPQLATSEDFGKYFLFDTLNNSGLELFNTKKKITNTLSLFQDPSSELLINRDSSTIATYKKQVTLEEIDFHQLKVLEDLYFERQALPLKVIMTSKKKSNIILSDSKDNSKKNLPINKPRISKTLLTPIATDNIKFSTNIQQSTKKKQQKIIAKKPTRKIKRSTIKSQNQKKKTQKNHTEQKKAKINIDDLLSDIQDLASNEDKNSRKVKNSSDNIYKSKIKVVESPKPKPIKKRKPKIETYYEEEYYEEIPQTPDASQTYYTNEYQTDESSYQYNKFKLNTTDDLMNSDISGLFLY